LNPDWVQPAIADNGPGIPYAIRQRLFDLFFTTKPIGQGTGLGLAVSYPIVTKRHGGKLTCHSIPGYGSHFVVELPMPQAKSAAARQAAA
jgi:signal transduction histidine kinase